mgnify:CR=1 FL=1
MVDSLVLVLVRCSLLPDEQCATTLPQPHCPLPAHETQDIAVTVTTLRWRGDAIFRTLAARLGVGMRIETAPVVATTS